MVLRSRVDQWVVQNVHHWLDSRRQLIYRIAYGLVKIIQFLSIHSSVKRSTDIGALQPDFNVFQLVSHVVLDTCGSEVVHWI